MRLIGEGAEARIYAGTILGFGMAIKTRHRKNYRIEILDSELRRLRTRNEARIMLRLAGSGIRVPRLFAVGRFSIYMEMLDGILLRDADIYASHMHSAGVMLGRMHSQNVAHGDFTPANLMLCGRGLYAIDFGLSMMGNSTEEKAIDLLLMKRAVDPKLYKSFIKAYSGSAGAADIIKRSEEMERRGRYQVRTLAAV